MKLRKVGECYVAESTFAEKDVVKGAGFWWHDKPTCRRSNCPACKAGIHRQWWTASEEIAARHTSYEPVHGVCAHGFWSDYLAKEAANA